MKKIVLIVGASGVGKDTLLELVKDSLEANFVKRYITRIPDENESNFYLDKKAFFVLEENGYFVSSWKAHGNLYGIAKEHIKKGLNIISVSRDAVKDFEKAFKHVTTIHVTLPKNQLQQRLENRKRETSEEIQLRLHRALKKVEAKKLIEFDNSDSLENSSKSFLSLLKNL